MSTTNQRPFAVIAQDPASQWFVYQPRLDGGEWIADTDAEPIGGPYPHRRTAEVIRDDHEAHGLALVAIEAVQNRLGVTDGGVADLFFGESDALDRLKVAFRAYARAERELGGL